MQNRSLSHDRVPCTAADARIEIFIQQSQLLARRCVRTLFIETKRKGTRELGCAPNFSIYSSITCSIRL
jgi:hypothetical protein